METCYKINNLIKNETGAFGFRNSYCLPFLSLLSDYLDSRDLLVHYENMLEMTSQDIIDKYTLSDQDFKLIYSKYLAEGIARGVTEMNVLAISPLILKTLFEEYKITGKILVCAKDIEIIPKIYKGFDKSIGLAIAVDPYIDGDELTNEVSEIAGKYKLPVFVTLYDNLEKTGMLNSLFNKPPINYIEDIGLLDRECYIFGGVCADKDDLSVMSGYNAKMIISPYDFLNLGYGFVNAYAMENNGVEIQLASAINNNMAEEIKLLSALNRGFLNDSEILPIDEILELVISKRTRIRLNTNIEEINDECDKIIQRIKEKI